MLQDVPSRNSIYERVDSSLHKIRDTSEVILSLSQQFLSCIILSLWLPVSHLQAVQTFAAEYLKTPLGEPMKGRKNKTSTGLWVEKSYKKTTNLPEPFSHELVARLENLNSIYLKVLIQAWKDERQRNYRKNVNRCLLNFLTTLRNTKISLMI
ncbi:hypothetical protein RchiOBHm_Chr4g0401771 [Rosa chinensis]|uniref:Uncharacterized protein n=1 Tax=Rosa chinensis TaxID=74649 RepID=A0A2P6QT71_ROSCH|nr:hypothetical protein RchiOBHm_Chr4g0401771 [Rosa chinensis]